MPGSTPSLPGLSTDPRQYQSQPPTCCTHILYHKTCIWQKSHMQYMHVGAYILLLSQRLMGFRHLRKCFKAPFKMETFPPHSGVQQQWFFFLVLLCTLFKNTWRQMDCNILDFRELVRGMGVSPALRNWLVFNYFQHL